MATAQLLSQLLERAPVVAFVKTVDRRYLMVNEKMCELMGVPEDQLLGRRDDEILHRRSAAAVADHHDEVVRQRRASTREHEIIVHGEVRTYLTSRFPLFDDEREGEGEGEGEGEVIAVGGIAVDITERSVAVRDLRASEARYRHLVDHAPQAFVTFDLATGGFTYVNTNAETLFGAPRERLLGLSPLALSPTLQPDGRPSSEAAAAYISRAVAGDDVVFDWMHQRVDGSPVPVRIWLGADGNKAVWASMMDMRELIASREAVERQKRLLDRTQALARVGGWELDRRTGALQLTRETYTVLGMDPDGPPSDLEAALAMLGDPGGGSTSSQLHAAAEGESFDFEIQLRNGGGRPSVVRVVGNVQDDRVLGAVQDITDQRRLEEQLLQSQKLESLGRLAGGIAHDFNNLLTVISNAVHFLEHSTPDRVSVEEIADIKQATRRAADLTTQMLAFARREGGTARFFDPNTVVERAGRMLGRLVGEDVSVELELAGELGPVHADPAHLEQVLVNLIVNARDAMPDGGRLTLRTSRGSPGPDATRASDRATAAWICIEVEDSGDGMAPEVQRRVFEPFFTTKPPGRGTGLGLSTVYGILQRWGGAIEVESELGRGTRFRTWWPERAGGELTPSDQGPKDAPSIGDETVLLVEDDEAVRRVTARGLRSAGFDVTVAEGPDVALSLVEASDTPFDLLIADVVMPGIGGLGLAERLVARQPDLRVLFLSGYAADALEARGVDMDRIELLQKPYDLGELTQRVRGILDR